MASDQQVSARAILRAETELRRRGQRAALQQLEQLEPDLTAYLWEELAAIHRQLLELGGSPRTSQRCYRRIQRLTVLAILAMRHGHHELWQDLLPPPPKAPPPEAPETPPSDAQSPEPPEDRSPGTPPDPPDSH